MAPIIKLWNRARIFLLDKYPDAVINSTHKLILRFLPSLFTVFRHVLWCFKVTDLKLSLVSAQHNREEFRRRLDWKRPFDSNKESTQSLLVTKIGALQSDHQLHSVCPQILVRAAPHPKSKLGFHGRGPSYLPVKVQWVWPWYLLILHLLPVFLARPAHSKTCSGQIGRAFFDIFTKKDCVFCILI